MAAYFVDKDSKDTMGSREVTIQTCNVTIDSNIFPNSSCSASIREKFQAIWFCRYGMLILETIIL
jgi:hypothetical protein